VCGKGHEVAGNAAEQVRNGGEDPDMSRMCAHDLFIAGRVETIRFAGAERAELTNFWRGHASYLLGFQIKSLYSQFSTR
jgi:hypothetical protein